MPRRPRHRPSAWLVAALGLVGLPVLLLYPRWGEWVGENVKR